MNALTLKQKLPRTWAAFFGRHGNFTPAQSAAIPVLLAGGNVLLCAPTASGKTEAVLAPLIERHLPAQRATPQLSLIYVLPTRALINDLWRRLATPCDMLRITIAARTRDFNNFSPNSPADLLLTTPESLDALCANSPKVLNNVQAIILDELHVFDGTVRGDQLRVLLRRLQQIRTYAAKVGDAPDANIQFAALSATLAEPDKVATRYFLDAHIISVGGSRPLEMEIIALDEASPTALLDYLKTFRQRGWRKALVFCNTRAEVEAYATAVRAAQSVFGEAIYVHYSNLEKERRHEIEQQFALAEAAICFASSTLELGIDIGSIDVALLIGAPGNAESFIQRIGRTNRRETKVRATCFYRTPLEHLMFEALPTAAMQLPAGVFMPSVAIQQIFSLLKQSPTAALRFKPLCELFDGLLSKTDLRNILGDLQTRGYLKASRMGEWRAEHRLHRLVDMQATEQPDLSLYSNIQSSGGQVKIRDQFSQRIVANVDRQWFAREVLTLEGQPLNVTWYDGDALWVTAYRGRDTAIPLHYLSARQMLGYELAQQLCLQVGLSVGTAPLIPCEAGWLCFHWLGDIYGQALLDLLSYTLSAEATLQPGLCVLLHDECRHLPIFTTEQVNRYLADSYRRYETMLATGAFYHLLPLDLRRRTIIEQFNVPRFMQALAALQLDHKPESIHDVLQTLLPT